MMVYFHKLAESPSSFREMVFPGTPPSRFRGEDRLPGTLCEFLDDPLYSKELELLWPSVLRKAHGVLKGAKTKGYEAGEIMDDATERALWAPIVCEAYAREFARGRRPPVPSSLRS